MRKRNKEPKITPPSATEIGDNFFYYEMPRGDETIAELMIRTPRGARIKHTVIHVHSPESDYYDNGQTAYVSRMAASDINKNDPIDEQKHMDKTKRLSRNPERTFRALARLANIVKLHGHSKEKNNEISSPTDT